MTTTPRRRSGFVAAGLAAVVVVLAACSGAGKQGETHVNDDLNFKTPPSPAPGPPPSPAPDPAPPPATDPPPAEPAAVLDGGLPAPCSFDDQCPSGVCEGLGCTDEAPGHCAPARRRCTRDLRAYCGCDGKTFFGSGNCPGHRYASAGECPAKR